MSLFVDITKRLGDFVLDVSFSSDDPSETLAILGASGCGKSMTLKCIAGIERPDKGRIVLNDRVLFDSEARVDVPVQERRVGYLFQSYALFPTMTVLDNVMAGVRGGPRNERRERALERIRAFRLEGLEGLRSAELSGGQQQRCALARIMANDPAAPPSRRALQRARRLPALAARARARRHAPRVSRGRGVRHAQPRRGVSHEPARLRARPWQERSHGAHP